MENVQTKWVFLKYEIRKFTIDYSKTIAKKEKMQTINLELKLKHLENNSDSEENRKLYNYCKNDLETIYDYIADDIKIRNKLSGMNMGNSLQSSF